MADALQALQTLQRGAPPLGAPHAPHEQEADRFARGERATDPGATPPASALRDSPWRDPLQRQLGPGAPLGDAERAPLEQRLGVDLGGVRVHRGDPAQQASRSLGAQAWTLGTDIVMGPDAPAPHTPAAARLLAHEVAHVLQQSHADPAQVGLSPAGWQVQRQPGPTPPAVTPGFSVNQAAYLSLVNDALAILQGRFVQGQTLAATVVPILQAMLASVTWKDASGAAQGGGTVQYAAANGVTLTLQLILNDAATPPLAGEFTSRGSSDGEMELFVRSNTAADGVAETLYHEALHLVSWLLNRPTPGVALNAGGRSGPAGAARTLDLSRQATQITTVRNWLDTLAQSVNARRGGAARIAAADLDRMGRWLVEEIDVRIETEVFRLAAIVQSVQATRGPQVLINPSTNWTMNAATLDRYVFDLSRVFLPGDRASLSATDRQTLATLLQILEGLFTSRVNRRFNPSPYLIGRGLPRATPSLPPSPLTPPTFRPLPLP
jgi:hypothetical protein